MRVLNGSEIVIECLKEQGVDTVFGYPGDVYKRQLTFYAALKWSVGSTFIACMLTIVGYSINATIVIFDRIRENLKAKTAKESVEEVVNKSITQTFTRSINTSLTTFIMVFVLYVMGVSSIREFALPLMVGIVCGTYSSCLLYTSRCV